MENFDCRKKKYADTRARCANEAQSTGASKPSPISQILSRYCAPDVNPKSRPKQSNGGCKEDFEERAAIMQFDGGLSKTEAEHLASIATNYFPDPIKIIAQIVKGETVNTDISNSIKDAFSKHNIILLTGAGGTGKTTAI